MRVRLSSRQVPVFSSDRHLLVHSYLFLRQIRVYEYVYEYGSPLGKIYPPACPFCLKTNLMPISALRIGAIFLRSM